MFVFAYTLTLALKVAGRIERGNVIFILVSGYYPLPWGKRERNSSEFFFTFFIINIHPFWSCLS